MERFLEKVALWLDKVRNAPVIGPVVEDLITMTQLLTDCARGSYEKLPRWTVFGLTAALVYAFSPIDLILDIIPFAGYLDDTAVIWLILELGLARDLMQYREWTRLRLNEQIDAYRRQLAEEYRAARKTWAKNSPICAQSRSSRASSRAASMGMRLVVQGRGRAVSPGAASRSLMCRSSVR